MQSFGRGGIKLIMDNLKSFDPEDIKGVVFDLDGTLYRMQWFMKPLLAAMLFPRSLRLPRLMAVRRMLAGKKFSGYQELIHTLAMELGKLESNPNTEDISFWIKNDFYTAFIRVLRLHRGTRKGINPLLESLKASGIKRGVLSDFARIEERLDSLQIKRNLFDMTLSSENEGALKPSPDPFMKFSTKWGIPPENILVLGDRDDTDGEGARFCGMEFINIRSTVAWKECVRKLTNSK